jgi:hypothetical protein
VASALQDDNEASLTKRMGMILDILVLVVVLTNVPSRLPTRSGGRVCVPALACVLAQLATLFREAWGGTHFERFAAVGR